MAVFIYSFMTPMRLLISLVKWVFLKSTKVKWTVILRAKEGVENGIEK